MDCVLKCLRLITVEPSLVLYMLAFMLTSVIEEELFVQKACLVNHNLSATYCSNFSAHPRNDSIKKAVQVTVSDFHFLNNIIGHIGQIVIALFLGSWSDRYGRKLPLLIGLFGKCYYSAMVVLNAWMTHWPVEYIVYTATLPMSITGADVVIFSSALTYLVDVSSTENRTVRLTLLEVSYLATMPIGIALGGILFHLTGHSFCIMFGINASLVALAFIYSLVRLKWRTTTLQEPLSRECVLFDINYLLDTGRALVKRRSLNRRIYLVLCILMMAFYTFQRDERSMMYLYVQLVFNWTFEQFSRFRTFQSALQDVALLVVVPMLSRYFKWRDTLIIMLGATAHMLGRVYYAIANRDIIFYIGGIHAAFGPIVAPVIRSIVSKLVDVSEKGKIFSILSVADNAAPIVSSVIYSKLYNSTIHTHPSSIYYFTLASQAFVFGIALFIHWRSNTDDYSSENVMSKSLSETATGVPNGQ